MNKALFVLTTLATMAVAPALLAQEQTDDQEEAPLPNPVPADPSAGTTTITSAEPPGQPVAPMTPLRHREAMTARQTIRPNRPLLITGTMTLLGSYATTVGLTAAASMREGNADKDLYIPVVGPWMHLASIYEGMFDKLLIAGSGVVQGAGLAITILSLIIPEKIPAAIIEANGVKVNLTATSFGKGSAGAGVVACRNVPLAPARARAEWRARARRRRRARCT